MINISIQINYKSVANDFACIFKYFLSISYVSGEYEQNLCKPNDVNCIPCNSRLPSCVGLPDGVNYYPGKLWTDSYVKCFRNRTISVEKCPSGYFHPRKHLCVKTVDRGN